MAFWRRRASKRILRRARRARRPRWVKLLFLGMVLMGTGLFVLINRFWPGMPGMDQLWPVAPMMVGMALLLGVALSGFRNAKAVFPGVASLGVGAFFLLITVGPLRFDQLSVLWPVFPLIAGVAFFWTWAATFGLRTGLLVPAILATAVGVVGLLFTLTPVAAIFRTLGWPLAIFLAGMLVVLVAVLSQAGRLSKLISS